MYSKLFNIPAANPLAEDSRLDANNTHAVTMGNLEVEGGSLNGRIATGSAFTADSIRMREERKKRDVSLILVIEQLRQTLRHMDERIEQLNEEITKLSKLRDAAETRSETAFARMHDLDSKLEDIEENGITDLKRNDLKRTIGQEAEGIDNDDELLECANRCIVQERHNGIQAHAEVQSIDRSILDKIQARDDLIKTRDEILSHPTASLEQKTALAEAALKRSIDEEKLVSETTKPIVDQAIEQELDAQRSDLTDEDNFDFDKDTPIRSELPVSEPGF